VTNQDIGIGDSVRRAPRTVETGVDDDIIILAIDTGACFGLNRTGARIWQLIGEEPTPLAQVRDRLIAEFEITPDACATSLLTLVNRMGAEGLVSRAED
jgi:hypothetical protein